MALHDEWIENTEDVKEYQFRYPYFYGVVCLAFVLLVSRLWFLQIVRGSEFKRFSEHNQLKEEKVAAPRGMVLDRNGAILVDSLQNFNVTLTPQYISSLDRIATELSAVIQINKDDVIDKVRTSRKQNGVFKPVRVKENVSRNEVAKIERMKIDTPGLNVETGIRRNYLLGENGAQLLGYTAEVSKEELPVINVGRSLDARFRPGDIIGKSGLEKRWDNDLRAVDGVRFTAVDANGREPPSSENLNLGKLPESSEGNPGHNITLTIDRDLQQVAYDSMMRNKKIGSVVALDPSTGEVLALVNAPSFDPNQFSTGIPPEIWADLINDPFKPLRNKAIQDYFPPASTFKPIVALAALQEKVITAYSTLFCPGVLKFGKRDYHCTIKQGHGYLNVYHALEHSCDVFFYKLGLSLGIDRIAKYARLLGLGMKTGINLDNEKSGLIPDSDWKKKTLGEEWQPGENLSNAIGQGFVSVTPIQMARTYGAIATKGLIYKPYIVRKIEDVDGKILAQYGPTLEADISKPNSEGAFISAENFEIVKKGLGLVFGSHGTAARSRIPGLDLAGKTGTVQLYQLTKETVYSHCEDKEVKRRHHGWLVAFAPVDDPKIVVAVFTEHSCHGAAAGPIVKDIIISHLKKYAPQYLKDVKLEAQQTSGGAEEE